MSSWKLIAPLAIIAVIGSGTAWWSFRGSAPDGLVFANGRIEGDAVVIATRVSGRLALLNVREGDGVERGQEIGEIDSRQLKAHLNEAAAVKAARMGSLAAAEAVVVAAEDQLHKAEADRAAAKAQCVKAVLDANRGIELFKKNVIPKSQLDEYVAARDVAVANLKAAEEQVTTARSGVAAADAGAASERDQVAAAQAALDAAGVDLDDARVSSPIDGVVTTKVAEEGEVLQPGSPIVVVVDLQKLYMKAFVPEPDIGRLKLGDQARIYVDAYPERAFIATVREIASRSEFTPKEVQTRDERVKQVIAVKLYLDLNPQQMLVPGMPADAVVRTKPEARWLRP